MKIALFFTYDMSLEKWFQYGLADREILLYKKIIEKGVDVVFITYGGAEDFNYQTELGGIEIIPFYSIVDRPKSLIMTYLYSFLLPFYLRKRLNKIDIYKTNQMWGSWSAVIAKLLFKKPLIIRCGFEKYYNLTRNTFKSVREAIWRILAWPVSFFAYFFADHIILTSYLAMRFVVKTFRVNPKKIKVLYNYIDIENFKPTPTVKYANRVLFLGRLNKAKNLFSLLDALENTNYQLDIVGDGELKDKLSNYISKKNISVKFIGRIKNSEVPQIINKYPVFALVSYYEGNPKALLEALACGSSVVCSDIESIREIIQDKNNGLLCKHDFLSIRNAINKIMQDKTLQKDLGKNAIKFIVENCLLTEIVKKEVMIYRKVTLKR